MSRAPFAIAVGGLCAMAAAMGIGRFVYTPILPPMLEAIGWSKSEAGLVASANFLGYFVGALAAARTQATGRQWTLLAVWLGLSVATTTAMALEAGVLGHAAIRFVSGIASAYVIVLASTLVLNRLAAEGRGALASVHFAGVGSGIMLSALAVSLLQANGAGWQELWLGAGVLAGLAALATVLLVPEEAALPAPRAGSRGEATARRTALFAVSYGLFGFGYIITATFIVTIVRLEPALRALEGVVWVLVGVAAVFSVPLWLRLAGRFGTLRAFAIASAAEAVGVALSVEWVSPAGISLAALMLGGTFMGLTSLGLVGARELSGGSSAVVGRYTAAFAFGQMIGPAAAGMLYDRLGSFRLPSLMAAAALLIGALLAFAASGRR